MKEEKSRCLFLSQGKERKDLLYRTKCSFCTSCKMTLFVVDFLLCLNVPTCHVICYTCHDDEEDHFPIGSFPLLYFVAKKGIKNSSLYIFQSPKNEEIVYKISSSQLCY